MSDRTAAASYDEVPYTSHAFGETHPARLAAVAKLLGIAAPAPETARVLEIGCARGGNLLAIARSLPRATCLGIDVSGVQIAEAQRLAEGSGLRNAQFAQRDIQDMSGDTERFDYVLCHGVLSWVPAPIRTAIFATTARLLSPGGVAFLSYNVDPGWRLRSLSREILRHFYARAQGTPRARLAAAREQLVAIAERKDTGPYHDALREEIHLLKGTDDAYVLHEHLEDHNEPLRFAEVTTSASAHGLAWLAEMPFYRTWPVDLPTEALESSDERALLDAQIELDLRTGRAFRRSLFVRAESLAGHAPRAEALAALHVRTALRPKGATKIDLQEGVAVELGTASGSIAVDDAFSKAAFTLLGEAYPRALRVDDLARRAFALAGAPATVTDPTGTLANDLLALFASTDFVDLLDGVPAASSAVPEKPALPLFVRERFREEQRAPSLYLDTLALGDPFSSAFVAGLDGTATVAKLHDRALALVEELGLVVQTQNGENVRSSSAKRARVRAIVEDVLGRLARHNLFAPPDEADGA